jgi:nitroimidazol reductase NimA-like FMN-containing flavoprotein (pyridoxamine 5'-phosphate oxidase superfamily)
MLEQGCDFKTTRIDDAQAAGDPRRMAMSAPSLQRTDMAMTNEQVLRAIGRGFVGRLATMSENGYPYRVPLLYVWADNQVFMHGTSARGHLRANLEREPRVCFELDEPDDVFDYGRFECDTGLAYPSVILIGRIRIAEDTATKQWFCERLMKNTASRIRSVQEISSRDWM